MGDEPQILVLDAGTTSTRAIVFALDGGVAAVAQRELSQFYPQPGWVEHDAQEIWSATLACAREAVAQAGGAGAISCVGITNQRETLVAWDKASGTALHRAIVWQDRRTADACTRLREEGREEEVQTRTGLLLDPYFSATKMGWLLEPVPAVREAREGGRLAFGTVESWLVWRLTGGAHVSDATNASRTSLLPLGGASWDPHLCGLFGVPVAALPEVIDCAGDFARTLPELFGHPLAITGLAGDQQAATIGQGCLAPGDIKATFGTGAFVLANMGARLPQSRHRLLGTVLHQLAGKRC
jgi:glycerol kinase